MVFVLSLCGLVLNKNHAKKDILVLIDSSISMKTMFQSKTRFDRAKSKAEKIIGQIDANTNVAIGYFNNEIKVISPFIKDKPVLKSYLNDIKLSLNNGGFSESFVNLIEKNVYQKNAFLDIVVITDHIKTVVSGNRKINIFYEVVGKSDGNIGITGAFIVKDNESTAKTILRVKFGCDNARGFLARVGIFSGKDLINNFLVNIPSGSEKVVDVDITSNVWIDNRIGCIKIDNIDALDVDNIVFFRMKNKTRVFLNGVSNDVKRFLNSYDGIVFCDNDSGLQKTDVAVSVNECGGGRVFAKKLIINPLTGVGSLSVGGKTDVSGFSEVSLIDESMLLKGVNFLGIDVDFVNNINLPANSKLLVKTKSAPLIFCVDDSAVKLSVINFDVEKSGFSKQMSFPVLLANMIDWLSSNDTPIVKADELAKYLSNISNASYILTPSSVKTEYEGDVFLESGCYRIILKNGTELPIYSHLLNYDESFSKSGAGVKEWAVFKFSQKIDLSKLFGVLGFIIIVFEGIIFYGIGSNLK